MTAPAPRGAVRRYRLLGVASTGALAVLVGLLLFGNLNGNLVYYLEPDEAIAQRAGQIAADTRFQLGGLVVADTVSPAPGIVRFEVSPTTGDDGTRVAVEFHGAPGQLFGTGVGVVLEGRWEDNTFVSDTMMVKHDENYVPVDEGPRP